MQAVIDGVVVADADDADIIRIEGNAYFPPSSLTDAATWVDSPTPYTCPWKGTAQYHTVETPSGTHTDAAWSYPTPPGSAIRRVGKDFSGYLAFDKSMATIG